MIKLLVIMRIKQLIGSTLIACGGGILGASIASKNFNTWVLIISIGCFIVGMYIKEKL